MPVAFDAKIAVGSIMRSTGINKAEGGLENQAIESIANTNYKISNVRVGCMPKNTHVPVMFWRSVGSSQNAFFMEVDELAQAAGQDPQVPPRSASAPARLPGVLDKFAKKGNWGKPLPAGPWLRHRNS
jgi:isoquinoline 1-oxidoreductase subunit beta